MGSFAKITDCCAAIFFRRWFAALITTSPAKRNKRIKRKTVSPLKEQLNPDEYGARQWRAETLPMAVERSLGYWLCTPGTWKGRKRTGRICALFLINRHKPLRGLEKLPSIIQYRLKIRFAGIEAGKGIHHLLVFDKDNQRDARNIELTGNSRLVIDINFIK